MQNPRISGIDQPGNKWYFRFMLKLSIIALIVLTICAGGYFLLAYRLDTIIVYDREAAYLNVGNELSVRSDFMVNTDRELRVFLNFENIHDAMVLKNLHVHITPKGLQSNQARLLSITGMHCGQDVPSFDSLDETCKQLEPGYLTPSQELTFAFDTQHTHTTRYLVTIDGTVSESDTDPGIPFSKQITIEERVVLKDRNWLF
jgi:hypothetical protein